MAPTIAHVVAARQEGFFRLPGRPLPPAGQSPAPTPPRLLSAGRSGPRQRVEPGYQRCALGAIFGKLAQAQALGEEPLRYEAEHGEIADRLALLGRKLGVPIGQPHLGALEELIGRGGACALAERAGLAPGAAVGDRMRPRIGERCRVLVARQEAIGERMPDALAVSCRSEPLMR